MHHVADAAAATAHIWYCFLFTFDLIISAVACMKLLHRMCTLWFLVAALHTEIFNFALWPSSQSFRVLISMHIHRLPIGVRVRVCEFGEQQEAETLRSWNQRNYNWMVISSELSCSAVLPCACRRCFFLLVLLCHWVNSVSIDTFRCMLLSVFDGAFAQAWSRNINSIFQL